MDPVLAFGLALLALAFLVAIAIGMSGGDGPSGTGGSHSGDYPLYGSAVVAACIAATV